MIQVEVCDMRAAGKPGYVAKINEQREKGFLTAKSYSSHGSSAKQVIYEISEDGIYEICDANYGGRKRKISFVLIQDGKDVFWSDSLKEVELKADSLVGKVEDWAVMPPEDLGINSKDRTVASQYPGLQADQRKDSFDVEIKSFSLKDGTSFLRVYNRSDNGFKFFMPAMKQRVNGRKWNEAKSGWDIPSDSVMLLREVIEEYTIRTNGIRPQLKINISSAAKTAMAMED